MRNVQILFKQKQHDIKSETFNANSLGMNKRNFTMHICRRTAVNIAWRLKFILFFVNIREHCFFLFCLTVFTRHHTMLHPIIFQHSPAIWPLKASLYVSNNKKDVAVLFLNPKTVQVKGLYIHAHNDMSKLWIGITWRRKSFSELLASHEPKK